MKQTAGVQFPAGTSEIFSLPPWMNNSGTNLASCTIETNVLPTLGIK